MSAAQVFLTRPAASRTSCALDRRLDHPVLDAVMRLLWREDYSDAPMADTAAATGLSTSSPYDYGSKVDLLVAALSHCTVLKRDMLGLRRGASEDRLTSRPSWTG
ncbi:TetR/AcrR family transcriptional regulator [Streptomyces sp. NBC_01537]|uniref:TetR/AcrR family transcriptional regulator n=1 Tax=Streptomyces sp. NBC_01537 TaxID=2903896 RepID=UPI0038660158